ncbi:MAG: hypothetical protein NC253_14845 [Ruminococcus sp.]|nr:hypothetical protein [Ruminococcus sp.]MCM1382287.1 hypothetical protein [Muribaculaceae bacterium]
MGKIGLQQVEKAVFNWLQKIGVWRIASAEKVSTFSIKAAALTPAERSIKWVKEQSKNT